ncbi:MAG: LPS export ABC transporter periplasmic protein LptC [bacterium]|nr:LPS export ABC transporter periplasmic protein LptC [bacterium]
MIKINKYLKLLQNLLIITVFVFIVMFSLKEPQIRLIEKKGKNPDFIFENVKISKIDMGEKVWKISSKYLQIDRGSNTALLDEVDGDLFKDEKLFVKIKSVRAKIELDKDDMELQKASAKFILEDRLVFLKANDLCWFSAQERFSGKGNIEMRSNNIKLSGDHLYVDIPLQKMIVADNALAVID